MKLSSMAVYGCVGTESADDYEGRGSVVPDPILPLQLPDGIGDGESAGPSLSLTTLFR
jgi:hypothetical protein